MKKIEIAEDDIYIGNMIAELLASAGYAAVRAYSGTEALLHSDAAQRQRRTPPAAAAQLHGDAREQFVVVERLGDIVGGAGVEVFHFATHVCLGAQNNDGALLRQFGQHLFFRRASSRSANCCCGSTAKKASPFSFPATF